MNRREIIEELNILSSFYFDTINAERRDNMMISSKTQLLYALLLFI